VVSNAGFFCEDKSTFHLDPNVLKLSSNSSLDRTLSVLSPAMIRSYGPAGSLSSVSLRGTGTNHTMVSWNGFTINSPTTGQVDISLIPAGFMQQVDVVNGASGALFGSGTFGGTVSMSNHPDWTRQAGVEYTADGGSFGTFSNRISIRAGNHHWQYQASFLHQQAENNFTYNDRYKYGNPILRRQHNSYVSTGLIQNFFINLPDNSLVEAGCWYQHKTLELPALMGSYNQGNALQKDSIFKAFLTYHKIFEKSSLILKSAWLTDDLHYTDKIHAEDETFSVNSKIGARQLLNEVEYRHNISDKIISGLQVHYNILSGISNNYGSQIREDELALAAYMKVNLGKWIGNAGLRKEYYKGQDPGLLYSLGWRFKASESFVLRANLSNKFRKPSFNEKYWRPGGNPQLRPEKGWGIDGGVEGSLPGRSKVSSLKYICNAYYQHIDNWIQWVIVDSLTPVEYKTVQAKGIEAELYYEYHHENLQFTASVIYNLNRSVITLTYDDNPLYEGRQLMYIPLHSGKILNSIVWKGWTAMVTVHAVGKRQTVDSNDKSLQLPGYIVADALAGYEKSYKSWSFLLGFRVENMLNQQYEIMRAYPMPGRAYFITLSAGFNKHRNEY